jgi:hypothetical protein
MGKVIRLCESDLVRLVKKVILETDDKEIRTKILRRVMPNRESLLHYIEEFNYDYTEGPLAAGYEIHPDIFRDDRIFVGYEDSPPIKNIDDYVELLSQHIISKELDDAFEETERWFEEVSVRYWRVMKTILFAMYPDEMKTAWGYYLSETKKNMERDNN